jgi:hypothetical protein
VVREGRPGGRILEIGAGTINHLPLENDFESYDIVEAMEEAYRNSLDGEEPDRRACEDCVRIIWQWLVDWGMNVILPIRLPQP